MRKLCRDSKIKVVGGLHEGAYRLRANSPCERSLHEVDVLKFHEMREITLGETKWRREELGKVRSLGDSSSKGFVDLQTHRHTGQIGFVSRHRLSWTYIFLIGNLAFREFLLFPLAIFGEELFGLGALITRGLGLRKVCVIQLILKLHTGQVSNRARMVERGTSTYFDSRDINLSLCGDDIGLVHPAEGNAVEFEWTGHKQQTTSQLFQENSSLATESAGEDYNNGAGSKSRTKARSMCDLAGLLGA